MAYDTKPTAEYVQSFAERQETWWAPQTALDQRFLNMIVRLKDGRPDVAMWRKDTEQPSTLMMGYANEMLKKNLTITGIEPNLKVNPETDDIAAVRKANGVLEPWVNRAQRMSEVEGPTWAMRSYDLDLYGRGVSCMYILPELLADGPYTRMVGEYASLVRKEGEDGSDLDYLEKERKTLRARMDDYLRAPANFPLRHLHWDAKSVFFQIGQNRPWPEAVYHRKMTPSAIVAAYGEKALPERFREENSGLMDRIRGFLSRASTEPELDVYDYVNYAYFATVVGDRDDPKLVRVWEHGMEESPVILVEGSVFPGALPGLRWESALFSYEDALKALDVVYSDTIQNHRYAALSQTALFLDPQIRAQVSQDMKAAGRDPNVYDFSPDVPFLTFFRGEDLKAVPRAEMSQTSVYLLRSLSEWANTIPLKPVENGRLQGAIAAVGQAIALQESKSRMSVVTEKLSVAAVKQVRLAAKYVLALDEKVYVHGNIGVTGKELKDIWTRVEPKFPEMLPVNENVAIANSQMKVELGVPRSMVLAELGYEGNVTDQRRKEDLQDAMWEMMTQQVVQGVAQLMSSGQAANPQEAEGLMNMLQNLPPELTDIAFEEGFLSPMQIQPPAPPPPQPLPLGPGTQAGSLGAISQGNSNVRRAGMLQELSNTAAQAYDPLAAINGGGL